MGSRAVNIQYLNTMLKRDIPTTENLNFCIDSAKHNSFPPKSSNSIPALYIVIDCRYVYVVVVHCKNLNERSSSIFYSPTTRECFRVGRSSWNFAIGSTSTADCWIWEDWDPDAVCCTPCAGCTLAILQDGWSPRPGFNCRVAVPGSISRTSALRRKRAYQVSW